MRRGSTGRRAGRTWRLLVATAAAVALAACAEPPARVSRPVLDLPPPATEGPLPATAAPTRVTRIEPRPPGPVRVLQREAEPLPAPVAAALEAGPPVTFNLRDATLPDMAEKVLGELLGRPYTIEVELPGTLTLATPGPVPRREILRLFEALLAERGAALLAGEGVWRIVAASPDGPALRAAPAAETLAAGIGYTVRTIRLVHILPSRMAEVLGPLAPAGTVRSLDDDRGLLVLAGPSGLLADLEATVALFDVDWLRRMAVALVPLRQADAAALAEEVTFAIATDPELKRAEARVLPVARARAVLVVARSPSGLRTVREMVALLDVAGAGDGRSIFVYEVQNRPAAELAALLAGVFGGTPAPGPGGDPRLVEATEGPLAPAAPAGPASAPPVTVTADDAANALVVRADPAFAAEALAVIERLDTAPDQVLLEVTIAEVTLSDDLRYGLEWYLRFGDFQGQLSQAIATQPINVTAPAAPGLSLLLSGTNATVVLNAISRLTDLKVVSTPSLMVLDNREARLQIGDQVPVVTQSAVSVTDPDAPIVNQVSYRDTGVTLVVTPRISQSGQVILTIEQDVSDVVETTTSGIDSPTIRQRRIATTVSVTDGESLALGGLIRDSGGRTENGVPFLKDIPVAGELFRTTGLTESRTELLVLITPRIVRDRTEARRVTEELRERLVSLRPPAGR